MSNELAIAAVTATLRNLITSNRGLPSGTYVTALSPEEAQDSTHPNQINLFLYHVLPNAAWRNRNLPGVVKAGETGLAPLALNLYYLLTAYHRENADLIEVFSHTLLGSAMSTLSDHPLLNAADIKQASIDNKLTLQNGLYLQPERVRITLQPLTLDEMSKIWTMFRARYRISVAYEISVVLIENQMPIKTPLPVLSIGKNNRGVLVQTGLVPALPMLLELQFPQQPSILSGDTLIINGINMLPGDTTMRTSVRFTNIHWQEPVELALNQAATATQVAVTLPNPALTAPVQWSAGFYTVALVWRDANQRVVRVTNELSFSLAPRILTNPSIQVVRATPSKEVTITLRCQPAIIVDQRASLLIGTGEILADPLTAPQNQLTFHAGNLAAGNYFLRLRVDGVDSMLVVRQADATLTFDASQQIRVPA